MHNLSVLRKLRNQYVTNWIWNVIKCQMFFINHVFNSRRPQVNKNTKYQLPQNSTNFKSTFAICNTTSHIMVRTCSIHWEYLRMDCISGRLVLNSSCLSITTPLETSSIHFLLLHSVQQKRITKLPQDCRSEQGLLNRVTFLAGLFLLWRALRRADIQTLLVSNLNPPLLLSIGVRAHAALNNSTCPLDPCWARKIGLPQ